MKLAVGQQLFVNGTPYRLLQRIEVLQTGEFWRALPLFVEIPERTIFIRPGDRCARLHTTTA